MTRPSIRTRPRAGLVLRAAAVGFLVVIGTGGCLRLSEAPDRPPGDATEQPADPDALQLLFPYGSEKQSWVKAVTADFNALREQTADGRTIVVDAVPMGSGELVREVNAGRLRAHLISPASGAFITLGNAESRAQTGGDVVGRTDSLVLSPVVIAMWRPMAEALGWGQRPLGWSDVIELANSPEGWAKYGFPQWGRFRFGHTHPEYSNSGLISLLAEVYAGAGKVSGLTLADLQQPEVGDYLRQVEQAVVHYGSSTGFFADKLFANGPEYLSAAVLYENNVIESYDPARYDLPFPVVAIYPKEGTFWTDHPVGVVDRPWVEAPHQEAARRYIDFLLSAPQQARALEFGFRPADVSIPLGAPIDAAHGVDPDEPQTTLAVPSADVLQAVIDLWHQHKKRANVVVALDTSGSMGEGEKIDHARAGVRQLLEIMDDADTVSLLPFSDAPSWATRDATLGPARQDLFKVVDSLFADGDTALYDAVAQAEQHLGSAASGDRIAAVVVLSDGEDTASTRGLDELLASLRNANEGEGVRVFTIGYGEGAQAEVLQAIAEATRGRYYEGTTESIREVFKEIATFF